MKINTIFTLPVKFTGVTLSGVTQIDFIFKQYSDMNEEALKTSAYKSDGTGDCSIKTGTTDTILVPFSKADTLKFNPACKFYMDTLITLSGTTENPETPIVELTMNPTLFQAAVSAEDDDE